MDRRLRELERAGDPVALLRNRLRARQLTMEQVELAACLGHPAALALRPEVELGDWEIERSLRPDLRATQEVIRKAQARCGDTFLARFAADCAERALDFWVAVHPEDSRPREAIAAARAWAECPCKPHKQLAADAARAARLVAREAAVADRSARQASAGGRAISYLGGAAAKAAFAGSAASAAGSTAASFARPIRCVAHVANVVRHARDANAADLDAEREWQRLRLATYVLGEVETGLDHEAQKELLVKHLTEAAAGSQLFELHEVLPYLPTKQVKDLLNELKDGGRIVLRGRFTRGARWYQAGKAPADG